MFLVDESRRDSQDDVKSSWSAKLVDVEGSTQGKNEEPEIDLSQERTEASQDHMTKANVTIVRR